MSGICNSRADYNIYFIFTDITELFSVYFKLVLFILIQVTMWYLFYHFFSFLGPAFYFQEFKFISFFFNSVTFFWIVAGFLSSYVLIPFGLNFFLTFQVQQGLYFQARISEYFSFYNSVYFLSLVYCQLFTFLFFFFADIRKNDLYIKKYRKLYYYTFLIFSTLITPPDLLSQFIVTFSVSVFYEVILFFSILSWVTSQS